LGLAKGLAAALRRSKSELTVIGSFPILHICVI